MYVVIEFQTNDSVATIVNAYDDRQLAESMYHQILSSAAVSSVLKHGAVMLTDEGERLKGECYYHMPAPEENIESGEE